MWLGEVDLRFPWPAASAQVLCGSPMSVARVGARALGGSPMSVGRRGARVPYSPKALCLTAF
eukprot:4003269-Pyramimonas_sp.AAC.1